MGGEIYINPAFGCLKKFDFTRNKHILKNIVAEINKV